MNKLSLSFRINLSILLLFFVAMAASVVSIYVFGYVSKDSAELASVQVPLTSYTEVLTDSY
ncbi:MAG: hypothetical protein LBD73_04705, partial [Deferribacteraceae bacterium]|nr:hypothetical protein [Deferribacteraceae bacterium]